LALQLLSPFLAGEESKEGKKMMDEGFLYAIKRKFARQAPNKIYREMLALTNGGNSNSPGSFSTSPMMNSVLSRRHSQPTSENYEPRSFPNYSIAEENNRSNPSSPRVMSGSGPKSAHHMNSFMRDAEMTKKTLAGLYCACTRDYSFGDVLLSKVRSTEIESNERHDMSCRSLDSSTMAPLYETHDVEAEETNSKGTKVDQNDSDIDWTKAFNMDHRRMITFGVMHNLIRRVHQYPLAYEAPNDKEANLPDGEHMRRKSSMSHDYDVSSFSHLEFSAEIFDDRHPDRDDVASVVTPTLSHSSLQINVDIESPKLFSKKSNISFAEQVALSMDGTRCDDELSCMFDTPVEELITMLRKTGRWNVTSVFSPCKEIG
jgi:hypothetical protein